MKTNQESRDWLRTFAQEGIDDSESTDDMINLCKLIIYTINDLEEGIQLLRRVDAAYQRNMQRVMKALRVNN